MIKSASENQTTGKDHKDHYVASFEAFEKTGLVRGSRWMHSLRRNALARFSALGFPTPKLEEWKYTSVAPIAESAFQCVYKGASCGGPVSKIADRLASRGGNRLVFVNGLYSEELSSVSALPPGVKMMSLHEAFASEASLLEKYLSQYVSYQQQAFAALNTAFMRDGAFLYIPKGTVVDSRLGHGLARGPQPQQAFRSPRRGYSPATDSMAGEWPSAARSLDSPLEIWFIASPNGERLAIQPRNLIVMGEGARASVVETYVSVSEDVYFTNGVEEIVLEEGASLDFVKVQRESEKAFHVATTQVYSGPSARLSSFFFDKGARLGRNNLNVVLDAEGCECHLNGLYLLHGEQHIDNTTAIDHAKPAGTSRQLYKGILDGNARAVFSGKIFVRRHADKTDAEQKNKNLLLSKGAKVHTRPQLEIFADDVKCAHGAAVGQLSEEEIFYLRSRGMGVEGARAMLTYGFAEEVLRRITHPPLREELDRMLVSRLAESREKGNP